MTIRKLVGNQTDQRQEQYGDQIFQLLHYMNCVAIVVRNDQASQEATLKIVITERQ